MRRLNKSWDIAEKASQRGYDDYHKGVKFEDNPFRMFSDSKPAWWQRGWKEAEQNDARKDLPA